MERIVTIDEAIEMLQEFKAHGGENVLLSELSISDGVSKAAQPISVNKGMLVIKEATSPISLIESAIMASLQTQRIATIQTVSFAKKGLDG